jgi:carboxylesterase
MQAKDEVGITPINPLCRTRLWSHGEQTPTAFVLLHGFTNCPAQFVQFGEALYQQGHNVLAPRLAHHGYTNRIAPDFARLTVEEMVALVSESCDALHGLGQRRVLIGFSLGGAMATWAAQQRADLDHVVIIAPPIALLGVPMRLRRLYATLLGLLPNRFVWWDGELREQRAGPPHAYPHYSTRAAGQMLRLGALLDAQTRGSLYAADKITVITNPCDDTVENAGIAQVVAHWRRQGGPVHTYAFPAAWNLPHDLFDPAQPLQQTARAYPQLFEWIGE